MHLRAFRRRRVGGSPQKSTVIFLQSAALSLFLFSSAAAQINTAQSLTPDVYFHQGDPRRGHCNNGWVIFDDYVIVIDANYPSGAVEVMPKVRASSPKPVRFVVDTHHHSDHAFGNQLWAAEGATIVAQQAAFEILQRAGPADWQTSAQQRPDVAASQLKLPSVIYPESLVFDDGHHRVELHWLGVAHTRGDTFLWLPKEKILFTGDACVNGPHNNVREGDTGEWIKTLERAKQFGAEKICPGHGPMGGKEILADQQAYFVALRRAVQALIDAKKTPAEVKAAAPELEAALKKDPQIARYVQASVLGHLEKVYTELGGQPLPR
jgi:glyoxylase-like metal-dependent hydrolase (beta-lactamase superfamily II)